MDYRKYFGCEIKMTQEEFEKPMDSINPKDAKFYIIRKPSDLENVYEDLESMGV